MKVGFWLEMVQCLKHTAAAQKIQAESTRSCPYTAKLNQEKKLIHYLILCFLYKHCFHYHCSIQRILRQNTDPFEGV